MAEEQDRIAEFQQMLARQHEMARDVPDFWAQMKALLREGAKDLQNTLNQVFFSQPSGPNEVGTPLAPTQAMITEDLGTLEMGKYQQMLDGFSTKGPTAQLHDADRGMER